MRIGWIGAIWGIAGVALLIVWALVRLVPLGLGAFSHPLTPTHWTALALWIGFMAYTEGYRGFHLAFSPMVAARARYLRDHPEQAHYVALAPLFCYGLIHATRRRKVRSTLLTIAIIGFIIVIRQIEQPWRGVVDLGVVVGLTLGLASLLYFGWVALTAPRFDYPPDVPEETLRRAAARPVGGRPTGSA